MELEGRRVLVVGLGRSGLAAARFLARAGAEVWATDTQPASQLEAQTASLNDLEIKFFLGGHPQEAFIASDLIVISPGVPFDLPPLTAARSSGVEIIGEMGLAAAFLDKPLIAVSGTNGKSTTTALIAAMLEASGRAIFTGGNIGRPLTDCLLFEPEAELAVVEVSSFQLETMPYFRPQVGVVVNLSPDHLNRHPDFDSYARLKARLWADMGPEDDLILNGSDERLLSLANGAQARRHLFSLTPPSEVKPGAYHLKEGGAWLQDAGGRELRVDTSGFKLPGEHNRENLLAALLAAWLAGADKAGLEAGLAAFKGLPHRLQWVARLKKVDYYDDSKATNVASAARSVGAFRRRIILIAGGLDKGGGYTALAQAGWGRLKAAVLIGQAAEAMTQALEGSCPVHRSDDLGSAVRMSRCLAAAGDVVLLAPACASFDQFKDYTHRGEVFAQAVKELEANGRG